MRSSSLVLVLLFVAGACSESKPDVPAVPKRERPLVITTIQPLHFFVSRIAGNLVDCEVVLPHAEDPQHFVPDRATLAKLLTADLVIFHGAGLEAWQGKVGLPRSRQSIVCTGWSDEFVKIEGAVTHTHGGGTHTHDGVDPFTWLDLALASKQAVLVAEALTRLLPDHEFKFQRHLTQLQTAIRAEAKAHEDVRVPGGKLLAADGVFAYWGRSSGNEIVAIDVDDPKKLDEAKRTAGGVTARVVLCATEPAEGRRSVFAALGLRPVVFDPFFTVAKDAPSDDFLDAMTSNRERLAAALAGK